MFQVEGVCSSQFYIIDRSVGTGLYLRPDGTKAYNWSQRFFKTKKEAQEFLAKFDVHTGELIMKFEVGKKYVDGHNKVVECIYVGDLFNNYHVICLDENNSVLIYKKNGAFAVTGKSKMDIVKEYIEPKKSVVYIAMLKNGSISSVYYSVVALKHEYKRDDIISIKRVELVEGEFDAEP